MLADEFGITREVAKERVYQALFKAETSETPAQPLDIQVRGNGGRFQEADVKFPARELSPEFDKVLCDGLVYQKGHKPRPPTNAEVELLKAKVPAFPEMRPDTPSCGDGLFDTHQQRRAERAADDGAQHSSLVPWWIGTGYHDTLAKRVGLDLMDAFYSRRTPDIWCLEPVVLSGNIPRELQTAYDFTKVDNVSRFVLKRNEVPAELDDQFPRLQVEMNVFEWETSEESFRFMYSPVGEKMILRQDYMNWARSN
jgi:hypothetical protein